MRVAIDGTPLTLSSGGLARYTQQLALALAQEFPGDEYVLVSDQRFAAPVPAPANLAAVSGTAGFWQRRWWSVGLPWRLSRLGADLFHGTDFAVPYLALRPSVLTLSDLSPWMDPAWHGGADRVRRRAPALIRLGLATMIVTYTEAVRRQAVDYFRIHPDRVVAVPLAPTGFAETGQEPVATRPNVSSPTGHGPVATRPNGSSPTTGHGPVATPYFLFVGTLEPRKNVAGLIAAWREVRRRHPVDLVLAGRRRADFAELPPESGLHWLGEVPDQQLPALYAGAVAFVYPSLYEGFGLPVLEAMQSGACVIASPDPAIREVVGDAALLEEGTAGLARAMQAVLEDRGLACEMRVRGRRRAALYSWQRTAQMTREVYEEAVRRFSH